MLPPPPAFVVSHDPARLAQFRAAWRAVGPRLPSLLRAVLAALFLQLAATVYAVASAII